MQRCVAEAWTLAATIRSVGRHRGAAESMNLHAPQATQTLPVVADPRSAGGDLPAPARNRLRPARRTLSQVVMNASHRPPNGSAGSSGHRLPPTERRSPGMRGGRTSALTLLWIESMVGTEVRESLIPPVAPVGPVVTWHWAMRRKFEHVMGYLAALLFG